MIARESFHTCAAQVPRRAVVVLRDRPQHGAQVVGDHDVEQRAERRLAALRRRCRGRRGRAAARSPPSTRRRGGSRRSRRGDGTRPPPATAAARASSTRVSPSLSFSMRSGTGTLEHLAPAGDEPERAEVEEAHVHRARRTGMVSATRRPPSFRGAVAGAELARHAVGLTRVDGEHVPVQRTVGGGAQARRAARSPRRRTGRGSPARCPRAWCPGAAPVSSHMATSSSGVAHRLAHRAGRCRRCATPTA